MFCTAYSSQFPLFMFCTAESSQFPLFMFCTAGSSHFSPVYILYSRQFTILPCLCFVQQTVHNSPCTVDCNSFTDRGEERPITTWAFTKLCICQKYIKPFALYGHQLALLLSLFFQTMNFQVWSFKSWWFFCASAGWLCAVCCVLCFVWHFCLLQAVLYIYWNYLFLVPLQEKIDTVTVEGAENAGEENCIEMKTEEDYIQLVRRVKCEQEVSVLCCVGVFCGTDLFSGVFVCVLYCTLCFVTLTFCTCISHLLSFCMSISRIISVIRSVWSLCVSKLLLISFSPPLTTSCHLACGNQYWCCVMTGGMEGQQEECG
jgi:hypothetical protein